MNEIVRRSRLLVDQGNSRVKLLFCEAGIDIDAGQLIIIDNDQLDQISVILTDHGVADKTLSMGYGEYAPIVAISVAPSSERDHLETILKQQFKSEVEWVTTTAHASIKGRVLQNAYTKADALGIDRWAGLAGALSCFPGQDLIVADFGTASTLDLLCADGQHLGGWIVPGLSTTQDLMRQRLGQLFTSHFTSSASGEKPAETWLGRSTPAAIDTGLLHMQLGLLDSFLKHTVDTGVATPKVLLTGGQVSSLLPWLNRDYCHMPRLVFSGIYALVNKNNAKSE